MSLSLSLSVSCPSVPLLFSHCLFLPFICYCFSSSFTSPPPRVTRPLSPTATPGAPLARVPHLAASPRASSGTLLSGAKVAAAAGLAVEREGRLGEKPAPVPPPGEDALRSGGGTAPSEPGSVGKAGRGRWRTVQSHLAAGKLNLSK